MKQNDVSHIKESHEETVWQTAVKKLEENIRWNWLTSGIDCSRPRLRFLILLLDGVNFFVGVLMGELLHSITQQII